MKQGLGEKPPIFPDEWLQIEKIQSFLAEK